jgi:YebC/PmpR family DNA-binding regulatory protein
MNGGVSVSRFGACYGWSFQVGEHQAPQRASGCQKGKIFTKWIRELTVAARQGGGDPASNPRLRLAQDKALGANMSRDIIDRAIARGAGAADADDMVELGYEGYGPGGVAVMVETMTDNRNRTAAAVRHAFSKCGGNLGTDGSVAYLFERKGQISFAPGIDEEALIEAAMEADADDVVTHEDGSIDVFTSFAGFYAVRNRSGSRRVQGVLMQRS